jgi:hypothetical protein
MLGFGFFFFFFFDLSLLLQLGFVTELSNEEFVSFFSVGKFGVKTYLV